MMNRNSSGKSVMIAATLVSVLAAGFSACAPGISDAYAQTPPPPLMLSLQAGTPDASHERT